MKAMRPNWYRRDGGFDVRIAPGSKLGIDVRRNGVVLTRWFLTVRECKAQLTGRGFAYFRQACLVLESRQDSTVQ